MEINDAVCKRCKRDFHQVSNLRTHLRKIQICVVHPSGENSTQSKLLREISKPLLTSGFACKFCGRFFFTELKRANHETKTGCEESTRATPAASFHVHLSPQQPSGACSKSSDLMHKQQHDTQAAKILELQARLDAQLAKTVELESQQQTCTHAMETAREALLSSELSNHKARVYAEVSKFDSVYIMKEYAELASDSHKIGKALDPKKREAQMNTGSAQGCREIYRRATSNAKIIEDIVKVAMKRYHILSCGGNEHYHCEVEHSVDVIDIASTVVDTLTSSYEKMKRGDLLKLVIEKINSLN